MARVEFLSIAQLTLLADRVHFNECIRPIFDIIRPVERAYPLPLANMTGPL